MQYFIGSFLLLLPVSVTPGNEIDYLTSIFTVTSAVCVTGLTVVDVSKVFSPFGQGVILFFIQLGGLGIMTFSSILFMMIGKRITYHEMKILKEDLNAENTGEIIHLVTRLVRIVFTIEIIGTVFLTFEFLKEMPFKRALLFGIFHSISAFCNAGFSLFTTGLEGYSGSIVINLTIALLIILGGIGFAVISSFINYYRTKKKRFNLSSKVVILISTILTLTGMVLFFALEYTNPLTIGNMNIFNKVMASFFQSVTTRTAGFNTVPMGNLTPGSIFLFCILMFIGGLSRIYRRRDKDYHLWSNNGLCSGDRQRTGRYRDGQQKNILGDTEQSTCYTGNLSGICQYYNTHYAHDRSSGVQRDHI